MNTDRKKTKKKQQNWKYNKWKYTTAFHNLHILKSLHILDSHMQAMH